MSPKKKKSPCFISMMTLIMALVPLYPALADNGPGAGKRYIDLRISGGAGLFRYDQVVDGGYYINNRPYNLIWYGWQFQLTGEVQFFIPSLPQLSMGGGGAYFSAPNPAAMDEKATVHVDAGQKANGGYGGFSASYWLDDTIRINFLAGYGGTGVSDKYGGWGSVVSIGFTYLFPSENVFGGLGIRLTMMNLKSGGDADTRGEKGTYYSLLLEASVDWAPRH